MSQQAGSQLVTLLVSPFSVGSARLSQTSNASSILRAIAAAGRSNAVALCYYSCSVPIKVEGLDLRKTDNALQHNTALYEGDQAVLRRGARFLVRFTLNQELDGDKHSLNVEFRRGASASFQRGTRFECVVGRRAVREWEWQGTVEGAVGRTVDAAVEIPVNAPVGEYEVIAEAVDEASGRQDSFTVDQKVVILFNPWNNSECVKPLHILCSMVLAARNSHVMSVVVR